MFNYLNSLFFTEKEEETFHGEGIEVEKNISNLLREKELKFTTVSNGYQIKLKDDYYLIIPFNINTNTYFYLQKGIKDRNSNNIKCTYFFKILEQNENSDIVFVNRIKVLNENIKCDEDYSRITKETFNEISNLVKDILNVQPKKTIIEMKKKDDKKVKIDYNNDEENEITKKNQNEKSNPQIPFLLVATTAAASAAILMSSESVALNNTQINLKGGDLDEKKKEVKKYETLKRLLEESLSE
jgi:hypothetical protein